MKYKVITFSREDWDAKFARNAHVSVFDSDFNPALSAIDFAMVVENDRDQLVSYCTCKELNKEQVVMEFGGTFPDTRGSIQAYPSFLALLEKLKSVYKKALFVTNNDNFPMLKMGLQAGFKITGVSMGENGLLVEHTKEF